MNNLGHYFFGTLSATDGGGSGTTADFINARVDVHCESEFVPNPPFINPRKVTYVIDEDYLVGDRIVITRYPNGTDNPDGRRIGDTGDTCTDQSADNYGLTGPCSYGNEAYCADPEATNYGEAEDCTYPQPPPEACEDPAASNYGAAADCEYPPPPASCSDPSASNYGDIGDCTYPPPPAYCSDPSATNYGAFGDCSYGDPSGGCSDPSCDGGGGYEDPCDFSKDPDCEDDPPALESARNAPVVGDTRKLNANSSHGQRRDFYVVMMTHWKDPRAYAAVGRFWHRGTYVDAIYLPPGRVPALGFIEALRMLERDRIIASDPSSLNRIIVLGGGQKFYRGGVLANRLPPPLSTPEANLAAIDKQLQHRLQPLLNNAVNNSSKKSGVVKAVKFHY